MRPDSFPAFKRTIVSFLFALLACVSLSLGSSAGIAAENPAGPAFKDPYKGGIALPNGGGEPGNAYTAVVNAAYKKDHKKLCELMAEPAEVPQCLQQKQALEGYIAMLTQPRSHAVLGGFMKGDEATLNVAYQHEGAPQNTGFVVMKKVKTNWVISSMGGSGSGTVSAEASGQADLGAAPASGAADYDDIPGSFAIVKISANQKDYTGRCPVNIAFTANITFKMPLPDKVSYHWELSNGRKTPKAIVKPPRNGHLAVTEVWRGGKPGEETEASVRFFAESGENAMILDPPGVKITCK